MSQKAFNLRRWRRDHELTLEDLADLTRLSVSTLSRVERGLTRIGPLDQVRIARIVGVRVRDLFPEAAE